MANEEFFVKVTYVTAVCTKMNLQTFAKDFAEKDFEKIPRDTCAIKPASRTILNVYFLL